MAIFDDVVVNAKSAAAVVSKKAGTIIDFSKLRISLASLRSELSKQYSALGEAVYNNAPEEELEAIKSAISDVKQNIDAYILRIEIILLKCHEFILFRCLIFFH